MQYALIFLLPMQPACDVHQATRICDHQSRGVRVLQIPDLSFQPFCRKFGMLHREDSAEPTAFVCVWQFNNLCAAYICQQRPGLTVDAHTAQRVTGWMIGERPIPARPEICYAQLVYDILCKFKDTFRERLCTRQPEAISLE